jgi:predicted XRE-type DNA-binding protein
MVTIRFLMILDQTCMQQAQSVSNVLETIQYSQLLRKRCQEFCKMKFTNAASQTDLSY